MKNPFLFLFILALSCTYSDAQSSLKKGDFWDWTGTYSYETNEGMAYTLTISGKKKLTAVMKGKDASKNEYMLNLAVEILDSSIVLIYQNVESGKFIDKENFDLFEEMSGKLPDMFYLTVIENEVFTRTIEFAIPGLSGSKENIGFRKPKSE